MKNKEFIKQYASSKTDLLQKEIGDKKAKINSLMFDATRGKIKNVREIKMLKREVAKLYTLLEMKSHES